MKSPTTNFASFMRTFLAVSASIGLLALIQTQVQTEALQKFRTRYKWVLVMLVFAVNVVVGTYFALRGLPNTPALKKFDGGKPRALATGAASFILLLLPIAIFLLARADYFGRGIEAFFRLLWLAWWLFLVQALGMQLATGLGWFRSMSAVILADGLAAEIFTLFSAVNGYPFSLGWSEASRYYYGSLFFARQIYGEAVPLSVMHGTRYLLQSIPYLMGQVPLWGARLWQVVLWISLTLCSAWALARRLKPSDVVAVSTVIAWLFLYYLQGAVYYHLQVPVIVVLLLVTSGKTWRSLIAVVAASFWAGMSRVNWFPVPAMLAAALYFLETPLQGKANAWRYLRTPVLFGIIGLAAALGGQAAYIAVSGNANLEAFASSFTSALLWYRWLPSATNPIGIIPGVILVSLPLVAIIVWRLRAQAGTLHPLRLSALAAMLVVLLAGGLIVSTKIGGGGDLHNMDAYMILLAILGAYAAWGPISSERRSGPAGALPGTHLLLLVFVPVAFTLLRLGGPYLYDAVRAESELTQLRQAVDQYSQEGEVLFMYERHLVTFGMVHRVPLVPEYEVVTLMEMAISGNEAYLQQYYGDLASHRFAAIVAHPQNLGVETDDFIEENNAWTRYVGQPLLCQYKPALSLDYSNVQVLVPRARPCLEFPPVIGGD